jgi:hypothetical protein
MVEPSRSAESKRSEGEARPSSPEVMRPPVTICALAASGDVYVIFGGGLVIPPEYDGILYQGERALGRLSPGVYNAAIMLQSLPGYDGADSTLYWCRRGPFAVELDIEKLPDPVDMADTLSMKMTLNFEVSDPVTALNRLLRGRQSVDSAELISMLGDDLRSLLDPMVACERRENLFRPSIFHETAGLTVSDYVNNMLGDRGVRVASVGSISFQDARLRSKGTPAGGEAISSATSASGAEGDWPAPSGRPNPASQAQARGFVAPGRAAEPWGQSERRGGGPGDDQGFDLPAAARMDNSGLAPWRRRTARPGESEPARNVSVGGASLSAPTPMAAGPAGPASAAPSRPAYGPPSAKGRPVSPAVLALRVEVSASFLAAPWVKFAQLNSNEARADFLRALDPKMLFSNDKIGELAYRLRPDEFDFRWATNFFVGQEGVFTQEQMRLFQRLIVESDRGGGGDGGDGFFVAAMMDESGLLRSASSEEAPVAKEKETEEGADKKEDKQKDEKADEEKPLAAARNEEARENALNPMVADEGGLSLSPAPNPAATPAKRKQPSFVEDVGARFPSAPSNDSRFGEVAEQNFRPFTHAGESGVYVDETINPKDFGELELLISATQTLGDKKPSRWTLSVSNNSSLRFSRVKVSLQSDSLVTTGFGLASDVEPASRRPVELRLARRGRTASRDGALHIVAIAYAEGAGLPCAYSAWAEARFKPSRAGDQHLVAIGLGESGGRTLTAAEQGGGNVDVADTRGSLGNAGDARVFTLKLDEDLTAKLRERVPDAERGFCPVCENETSRRQPACQACSAPLPDWFRREPVLLTPEYSNARARVERARLWVEGESLDNSLFVVLGGALKMGRRQDNDFVLRVYEPNGQVDERRTTELSRVSGVIDQSRGSARFTCLNRHGVRVEGKFVPCDQSIDLPDDARFEFLNRQGEAVLTLLAKVVYDLHADETGSALGPQAIFILQEEDPRRRGCLFLLKSAPFAFEVRGDGSRRLLAPAPPSRKPEGWLIYHEECLWLAPEKTASIVGDRRRDMMEVQPQQLIRVDDNIRADFGPSVLRMKIYRGSVEES